MKFSDIAFGQMSSVYWFTIILTILTMMLLVSLRLMFSRRKKAYLSMTLSVMILMCQYVLNIRASYAETLDNLTDYSLLMLKIVSFTFLNLGVFQVYNTTRKRHSLLFSAFLLGSFAVSGTYFLTPDWVSSTGTQLVLLQQLWMNLYLYVLIFLGFTLIAPRIGQAGKYQVGLTIYFFAHTAHMVNTYMFAGKQPFYTLVENMLPVAFFMIMFLLLFERVIELMQAIYTSSITDGLTRLYNRKYFDNVAGKFIQRHVPVSVIFSDIDNFKKLNDTKGHDMGDKVLKQVANILREESEEYGICGRYGGEEMVVLVTDPDANCGELAERIRLRIEAETIATVSMGYSKYKQGVTRDELIKQADDAMYTAKKTGKNKVVKYSKSAPKAVAAAVE
ncbi:GGDEF domain-containing protein [Paenibacillus thalictri]|uniref:GGDEF domain-containing protein n=1 Tax=Paenibacillus thalictri TaxID=2527873 RepID=A0A4Q9DWH1_9BACL|nr:GGDEF domain-containing protein [Paenibacillus thalictri]TBL81379.1 GGDEF domain-containing protein [Paenibacillus thalictri]